MPEAQEVPESGGRSAEQTGVVNLALGLARWDLLVILIIVASV